MKKDNTNHKLVYLQSWLITKQLEKVETADSKKKVSETIMRFSKRSSL